MHSMLRTVSALAVAVCGTATVGASPHLQTQILLASTSFIGVGVMDVSDETAREIGLLDPHGIEISSVAEDSPGDIAGLQAGDVVLTYRGERVNGYEHFARLVRETPPGRKVELGIVRKGQRRMIEVEIGRREAAEVVRGTINAVSQHLGSVTEHLDSARSGHSAFVFDLNIPRVRMNVRNRRLGIEMENLDGQLAEYFGVRRGVLVRAVGKGSIADDAGVRAGDVIVSVASKEVRDADDVRDALASNQSEVVVLGIFRDRERAGVTLVPRPHREPGRDKPISLSN